MIDQTLDHAFQLLNDGEVHLALQTASTYLHEMRQGAPVQHWDSIIKPACDRHSITQIVLEDPFTRRAREKPRGYAGDAEMIDYIYSQVAPAGTSDLGAQVFGFTTNAPSGQAVRWRLDFLAAEIDRVADRNPECRVLSLACGHLREVDRSLAVKQGRIAALHAIDQDPESLAVVRKDYAHLVCIQTHESSVRSLLKAGIPVDDLQLAYAAGLYDYLDDATARALTEQLFSALAPGGCLIVPNFLRTNFARGYMESFMEWNLIVRNRKEIEAIAAGLPADQIANVHYFEDPQAVIGYLVVDKRT